MKKTLKISLFALLILLACALMLTFTACDEASEPDEDEDENEETNAPQTEAHTHAFGEWEITKSPSFTEEGIKTRYCSCGEKQTETIAQLKEESSSITSLQCKNELQAVYNKSLAQKSIWFLEDDWVYASYFDGKDLFYYSSGGKDGEWEEEWFGNSEGQYYWFYKETDENGITTQTYETVSKEDADDTIDEIEEEHAEDVLGYLDYAMSLISESTNFECLKTTGENTTYQIKLTADGDVENITITVVDGLITIYDHTDYTTATYTYNKIINLPDKDDYLLQ